MGDVDRGQLRPDQDPQTQRDRENEPRIDPVTGKQLDKETRDEASDREREGLNQPRR